MNKWTVPKRQQCKKEIAKVELLIIEGLTQQQISDRLMWPIHKVKNIITRHTVGMTRLRHEFKNN